MERLQESIPLERLAKNLRDVRARLGEAAAKAARAPDAVRLVAVTKYAGPAEVRNLGALGVTDFGESRVQDAEKKIAELEGLTIGDLANPRSHSPRFQIGPRWHLIGHLQTNKAAKATALFQTIHSVDSIRVAKALEKECARLAAPAGGDACAAFAPLACLLEVNVAGEAGKFGLPPNAGAIAEVLKSCTEMRLIRIAGLMTMAPYSEDPEPSSRHVFRRLRELAGELNTARCYPHTLTELSMGMTQDYWIAVEEGATVVRVGTALFR